MTTPDVGLEMENRSNFTTAQTSGFTHPIPEIHPQHKVVLHQHLQQLQQLQQQQHQVRRRQLKQPVMITTTPAVVVWLSRLMILILQWMSGAVTTVQLIVRRLIVIVRNILFISKTVAMIPNNTRSKVIIKLYRKVYLFFKLDITSILSVNVARKH